LAVRLRAGARRLLPAAIVAAAVLAFYGPALGRWFVSEDFLLLRFLAGHPPWSHPLAELTGPWLGISVVRFYRPVSTLLLALEGWLFGAHPLPFNLVHVAVHACNAWLVYAFATRMRGVGATTALAAALLFAVYPLHPNAVLFIASFATLFATAFVLGALVAYQRFRREGGRGWLAASLGLFALALGSYEAAAILPVLVLAYELLIAGSKEAAGGADVTDGAGGTDRSLRGAAVGTIGLRRFFPAAAFFALLAGYLMVRKAIFGVVLGGYRELGETLLGPRPAELARNLAVSIERLYVPVYGRPAGAAAPLLLLAALWGVPLAVALATRRRLGTAPFRRWLFGWVWTLAALAPFAFRPAVPGNGRYWYLAAIGLALTTAFLAAWAARGLAAIAGTAVGWRRALPMLPALAVVALAVFWCALLAGNVAVYRQAGRTARAIQGELARVAAAADPGQRLFVTGYPTFLHNAAQVPLAQVFHYGLADSIHPPFGTAARPVYPIFPMSGAELLPVTSADSGERGEPGAEAGPANRVYLWDGASERLEEIAPGPAAPDDPRELAALPAAAGEVRVAVPAGGGLRYRMIVVAEGNPTALDLGSEAVLNGVLRAPLPYEFIASMDRLYGGEQFWWVEAHDAAGRLTAYSRMRVLPLDAMR
jgi:hypothetical protein